MTAKYIVKFLTYRIIDRLTVFSPFDSFVRLPCGKYGKYICEHCERTKATHWNEKNLGKYCFKCAFDSKLG